MLRSSSKSRAGIVAAIAALLLAGTPAGAQTPNPPGGGSGGGGTGCVPAGMAGSLLLDSGAGACTSNGNATATAGALSLGGGGTPGSLTMGNATSGTIMLEPVAGALGVTKLSLPAGTDTIATLTGTQTFSGKSISGSANTLSNIGNSSLTNSSLTIAGHLVSLGGTQALACADLSNGSASCSTDTTNAANITSGTLPNARIVALPNTALANAATTVNGQVCTLGSTCTVTAAASGVTVGTTTIGTGTTNGLLYDNAGVLGNLATVNSGVLVTSGAGAPSISTTLPSGLTIPAPALSGTITGTPTWASGLNIASGQTYKINGTQIACANLSDAGSGCSAQQNTPYWRVYRSTDQTLSTGVNAQLAFNAASYDSNSSCNLSTGACSPQVAGLYLITCQVRNSAATGPAAGNNALSDAELKLNGTIVAQNYQATQVSSLTGPVSTSTVTSTVKLNGTTDTVTCATQIDGTTPIASGAASATYMSGFRTGAQ